MKRYLLFITLMVIVLGVGIYQSVDKDERVPAVAMYQGNNQHTGVYETQGLTTFEQVKWKFKTGGPINSAPIVDEHIVYIGSDDDCLYALDIQSGKEIWKYQTKGDIRSTSCINKDYIFFLSEDGNLYTLNKHIGEKRWHFSSGDRITKNELTEVIVAGSPAVENETVFFGSYDGHMYALDVETGDMKWKFKTGAGVKSSPALYKGKVYFGSFDGYMYCLDMKDGSLKWKYQIKPHPNSPIWEIQSSPTIYEDIVYFGSIDHCIYALDSRTGKERWAKYFADQPIYSTLAYKEGVLYHGTLGWHNPRVCAVEADGKIKWKFQVKDRGIWDSKGNVYIGSWMNDNLRFFASPVIAGEMLYIGSWDKNLYALDINTGEMQWKFTTEGPIGASAAVKDGIVYVGSYDGYIYALSGK
ncbi:MAG: PQQ-binding-like beta-propeller repeat protein [Bacillota bacterium]